VHCSICKSESNINHEMESYQYDIEFCPFCGEEIDEDERELIDEIETE
jgi:hypothetical protein